MQQKIKAIFLPLVDRLRMGKRRLRSRFRKPQPVLSPLPQQKGGSRTAGIGMMPPGVGAGQAMTTGTASLTSQVPLFLQTDDRWKDLPYGTDGNKSMEENGCAIAALAMIGSHYGLGTTPEILLEWARNDYYVYEIGTSWEIFSDFALSHGLYCLDLENDIDSAIAELRRQRLVVVSVRPGKFTDIGHIMLLTSYRDGKISINDPNDDEGKQHSSRWFTPEAVAEDSLHFWSFHI